MNILKKIILLSLLLPSLALGQLDTPSVNRVQNAIDVDTSGGMASGKVLIVDSLGQKFAVKALSGDVTVDSTGAAVVANDSHTHVVANLSNVNAGTNLTADLEEEAQVGTTNYSDNAASGEVAVGTSANNATWRALTESDISNLAHTAQKVLTHATDCTSITTGVSGDICTNLDDRIAFACIPTSGGCDTAAEWQPIPVVVFEGETAACVGLTNFSTAFSVSQNGGLCDVAPGTTFVITADGTIQKVDLPSAVAYEDEANVFTADQTLGTGTGSGFLIEQSGGTDILDCANASSTSCRYYGTYSNADDIPTKSDIDLVRGGITLSVAMTNITMANNASPGVYLAPESPAGTFTGWARMPVSRACTVTSICAGKWPTAIPTGNTLEIRLQKNASSSGEIGCDITAGNNECCLSSGTLAFAVSGNNPDDWRYNSRCVNAGSACTDATAEHLRITGYCEFQ